MLARSSHSLVSRPQSRHQISVLTAFLVSFTMIIVPDPVETGISDLCLNTKSCRDTFSQFKLTVPVRLPLKPHQNAFKTVRSCPEFPMYPGGGWRARLVSL